MTSSIHFLFTFSHDRHTLTAQSHAPGLGELIDVITIEQTSCLVGFLPVHPKLFPFAH